MLLRQNVDNTRQAEFSNDRVYRYSLTITWENSLPLAAFLGLNPSTADETQDDPTIRRCKDYAARWGCGGIMMLNLFAYRATDPKDMKRASEPIGKRNTLDYLAWMLEKCKGPHIACWGRHGPYWNRAQQIEERFTDLQCLSFNSDGTPAHPLYLPAILKPIPLLPKPVR